MPATKKPSNITLKLPNLHTGQKTIIKGASRYNAVACGRRFGKTVLGLERATLTLLQGLPVAWCSPSYKMLDDCWDEALATLGPVIGSKSEQNKSITLINGAKIEFWSLENPDNIRGRKYARIIVDEAAMVKDLQNIWFGVLRPTLVDYKGDAFFLSTPRALNYFYTMFLKGQDPLETEWASFQMPTIANPFIDPKEIEDQREGMPQLFFEQEYEAKFLTDSGGVFRGIDNCLFDKLSEYNPVSFNFETETKILEFSREDDVLVYEGQLFRPRPYKVPYSGRFVMGLDWAMKNDFTVITVMDADTHQVVEIDRFNQIGWEFQRQRVEELANKWDVIAIVSEHNSIGGPNEEELIKLGLPVVSFVTSPKTKPPLIESLALAFEQRDVWIPSDPILLGELRSYDRTISAATGRPSYSSPAGGHDDMVMSLALAFFGAINNREPLFGFISSTK